MRLLNRSARVLVRLYAPDELEATGGGTAYAPDPRRWTPAIVFDQPFGPSGLTLTAGDAAEIGRRRRLHAEMTGV